MVVFKRARSIDDDSQDYQSDLKRDKLNSWKVKPSMNENMINKLHKIFWCHSWEKLNGKSVITVSEFLKIMKNLKILPDRIKMYTMKAIINKLLSRSQNRLSYQGINFCT